MKGDKASEILLKAADLLEKQPKLGKADTVDRIKNMCVLIAIDVAESESDDSDAFTLGVATDRVRSLIGKSIISWNDSTGTTKRKAISTLRKAAKL